MDAEACNALNVADDSRFRFIHFFMQEHSADGKGIVAPRILDSNEGALTWTEAVVLEKINPNEVLLAIHPALLVICVSVAV